MYKKLFKKHLILKYYNNMETKTQDATIDYSQIRTTVDRIEIHDDKIYNSVVFYLHCVTSYVNIFETHTLCRMTKY